MNNQIAQTPSDVEAIEKSVGYPYMKIEDTPLVDYVAEASRHMNELRKLTYFTHLVTRIKEAQVAADALKELVDSINLDPSVLERL